jgi:hypothetical protein
MVRCLARLVAGFAVGAALSACTSTAGHGGAQLRATSSESSTTAEAVTTPAATTQPVATPRATSTASDAAAGPPPCRAEDLTVSANPLPGGSAAGHTGVLLDFLNHGSAPCTLFGYPGVAGLDAAGHEIAQASRTTDGYLGGCRCTAPSTVTIVTRSAAHAIVEGSVGSGNCDQFSGMLITPPNTAFSTRVSIAPHSCQFTVHPVLPGIQ